MGSALAQEVGEPGGREAGEAGARQTFRVGYVRQDPESLTTSAVFQRMGAFLVSQPEISAAMVKAGVRDIVPQSFDSHVLLVEAMDAEQLDMAFCSVIDYGYQQGGYVPVYQVRRPGDPHSSTGSRRAWHSGVIFVNNRSPLFDIPTSAALAALPDYLLDNDIAMVGSSSAAGYVYPYLALDRLTTASSAQTNKSVFWGSSAEVVKSVINGIHSIGACEADAIDEVLLAYGLLEEKPLLVKELMRTDPVPRDPVVIHPRWLARTSFDVTSATELGRRIVRGVAGFFESEPHLPRLDRTTQETYLEVSENLQRFQQMRRQDSSGF